MTEAAPRDGGPLPAVARLAARAVGAPLAAVSRGDELHAFGAAAGRDALAALARLCARAAAAHAPVLVADADEGGGVRAWAGISLGTGGLVVADTAPRAWTERDAAALADAASVSRATAPAAPRRGLGVFRAMFEGSVAGLAVLDPRGRILRVNRSLGRMLGAPPSRLFGRPFQRYLRGDPHALEPLRAALAEGRSADVPHDLKLVSRRGGAAGARCSRWCWWRTWATAGARPRRWPAGRRCCS